MNASIDPAEKSADTSVLLTLLPHVLKTLKREPALGITVCYLLVAMAGIFYNYSFYRKFDIPVLTLSQISDFLVAGIQQPMALLLVLTTFLLCWLIDKFNDFLRPRRALRRERLLQSAHRSWWKSLRIFTLGRPAHWITACLYLVLVVDYGWIFVSLYAEHRATAVISGKALQVRIWLVGADAPLPAQAENWTYLGANSNYVFVYDRTARHAQILPIQGLSRIEPVTNPVQAKSPVMVAPIP